MARTRATAGPLLRLLGLAVMLCAVALMHGVIPESAGGHLVTSAVTSSGASAERAVGAPHTSVTARPAPADARFTEPADGHGEHGPSHPGDQCVSAQPHQGPVLAQPRFAPSVSELVVPSRATAARGAHEPSRLDQSSADVRAQVVQQV